MKTSAARREREEDFPMIYRETEYSVVQGIRRGVWKWAFSHDGVYSHGQAESKAEAVVAVERAIDRALAPKKIKLERPDPDV